MITMINDKESEIPSNILSIETFSHDQRIAKNRDIEMGMGTVLV